MKYYTSLVLQKSARNLCLNKVKIDLIFNIVAFLILTRLQKGARNMLYLCWNNAKTCGRWKPFYKPGKKQQRLKPFHDIAKNKYYLATRLQKN